MSKNVFIAAIMVFLSMALCPLLAQNITKDCNVSDFTSINLQSVGNIIFTQSDSYSCRMEGPAEFVEKTQVSVQGSTLIITHKQQKKNNIKNLTLYISAPILNAVQIDGVGNFTVNETLKLKTISFQLNGVGNFDVKNLQCDNVNARVNGVGNMELNVNCRMVDAAVSGVGSITLSGKADTAELRREGIGKISHKKLKCPKVNSKG